MTNLTMINDPSAARSPRVGETFTCCETPLPWPTRTEDHTWPECGTVWEHDGVDLGAGARIKPGVATEAGLAVPSPLGISEPADLGLVRQADAGRPYWLPGPCPDWCAYPEDHDARDHPDDRVHMGSTWDITLTLEDPAVTVPRDLAGHGPADRLAGLVPAPSSASDLRLGYGLWVMHQLDLDVALRHADDGFTVRLRGGTITG
jgi:hypothetical protein